MLSDIITIITTRLTAAGVTAPVFVGPEHIAKLASPPRIVFSPGARDTFRAPREVGGRSPQVAVRMATLEVRIWGPDLEATETLLEQLVVAALGAERVNCQVSDALWFGVDGELVTRGYAVLVNLAVEIPIRKPAATLAPVETVVTTTTIP